MNKTNNVAKVTLTYAHGVTSFFAPQDVVDDIRMDARLQRTQIEGGALYTNTAPRREGYEYLISAKVEPI